MSSIEIQAGYYWVNFINGKIYTQETTAQEINNSQLNNWIYASCHSELTGTNMNNLKMIIKEYSNVVVLPGTKLEKRKVFNILPEVKKLYEDQYNYKNCLKAAIKEKIDFYKSTFHLSQEEIDQIMKELKEAQQLNFPYFGTEPEKSVKTGPFEPFDPKLDVKYTPMEKKNQCEHDWKTYIGLNQSDTYCTKCNEIKK